MFIVIMPPLVDIKTYLTCYHEIHTLKIIDLSDLGFMHPALGKLDSAVRELLGVQNCCLRTQCIRGPKGCNIMDSYYGMLRKRKSDEMMQGKQQTSKEMFNQASQSIQEKMNNKTIICRAFNIGRCGKGRFCQNFGGHGDADAAKKIRCASADEPGDVTYHHKKSKCAYTAETCIYHGHVDKD